MIQKRRASHRTETLCWTCMNAVPNEIRGCNWSRFAMPVAGWNAKRETIKICRTGRKPRTYEAFHVKKCPEYQRG